MSADKNIVAFPVRTYSARPFTAAGFLLSGTLDGFIDFAVRAGLTYQLTIDEARALVAALNGAIIDVEENCLFDRDVLLVPSSRTTKEG